MESYLPLIIQLVAGLIGGNAAGSALKEMSLGTTGNSVVGAIGGVVLGQILQAVMGGGGADMAAASGMDIGKIITDVVGGGAGGAILTAVIGLVKNQVAGAR